MKNVFLASFLILTTIGCSKTVVKPDIPCPNRPQLVGITEDLQLQTPEDVLFIVAENQLRLKKYAKQLEARAGCEL